MAALFFELLVIRYIGTEIRIFAYLKNITLIAGFCGIGIGMVLVQTPSRLRSYFPLLFALLFLSARYSQVLGLTHIGFSSTDDYLWGMSSLLSPVVRFALFIVGLATFFILMIGFFVFFGCLVGTELKQCRQLPGLLFQLGRKPCRDASIYSDVVLRHCTCVVASRWEPVAEPVCY